MKRIDVHAIPEPAREPSEAPASAPVIAQPTDATLALLEAAVRKLLQELNGNPAPARHAKKRWRIGQTEVAVLVFVTERKNANGHSEWIVERVRLGERALGMDVLSNGGELASPGSADIGPVQGDGGTTGTVAVVVEQYASRTTAADAGTTTRPA
ncbi:MULTISPECIES: hypothetical protein [Ralstonia solanacearum species complex]|uniref:Type III effector protein n=3 Tax=Ralstonia solanacearum species complex TaxID=3116862 RepID=A0A0K1ZGP7_RALSL|nr:MULTISPECIES: hypothetical protein [Ralstonia]AKZ25211.1 type III effector protein [Ralstonia solanacearum]AGH85825.1 hypothetical protein F504_3314 [Ralstonia pseudosolanacearum FQY_4]ANH31378.1 hypothetical protein A3768_0186 [Ralstonia solanacearum]ARU21523.1 IclR family transcriptional regulator [Ralstonia solanacearum]AST28743.1 type III effector protein [Ralstonia pseudosolanacearum]